MTEETRAVAEKVAAIGLEGVAAQVYAAALKSGEASVSELARVAEVPRTSADYALGELTKKGLVLEAVKGRSTVYRAVPLASVFEEVRDSLRSAEKLRAASLPKPTVFRAPEAQILRGPAGFREAWRRVLSSGAKSFTVISNQKEFRDYMREHDILEDIIAEKMKRNLSSRNVVVDTPYSREISKRDPHENRETRFLPKGVEVPCVEVACDRLAFIAMPRQDGTVVIFDYPEFGEARLAMFDALWAALGKG